MSAFAVAPVLLNGKSSLSSRTLGAPGSWAGAATGEITRRLDSELSVVERCLRGEQGGWEELIQNNTKLVYAICYRFTNR